MRNQLATFWNKYQIFIWPILGGGISIGLLALVIVPQFFKVLETNAKIEETSKKIEFLNNKISALKQINVSEYKDNYNKLNVVIPAQIDAPSAISQVQSLATSSNIQVTSFNISLPQDSQQDSYTIRLEFTGDINSVNRFITQLKAAPRLMTINKMDLSSDKNGAVYTVNIDIQTYFGKQQAQLSSIEGEISLLSDQEKSNLSKISQSVKSIPIVSEQTITGPKGKSDPFQ